MIFIHKINTGADFVTAQAVIPADNCLMGHYDSHILMLYPHQGTSVVTQIGRIHANPVAIYCRIFKWTWRVLNFVREMVLNLFFIFLVPWALGSGCRSVTAATVSKPRAALCCWIFPASLWINPPPIIVWARWVASYLAPAPTVCRKTPCLTSSTLFVRRKMTVISRVSFWI